MKRRALADRVIVALDTREEKVLRRWLREFAGLLSYAKVGSELFSSLGPRAVRIVKGAGFSVFLDLKFHDIPNTVGRAVAEAARLGVDMVNVHASGGEAMMRAAREALGRSKRRPLLLAVTVLTSLDPAALRSVGVRATPARQVALLARLAQRSGCDGVVASGQEIGLIRKACGQRFLIVTPGIRLAGDPSGDQKRILDPRTAFRRGADSLVIGRPLTAAASPRRAAQGLLASLGAI